MEDEEVVRGWDWGTAVVNLLNEGMQVPSDTRLNLRSWEEGVIRSLASTWLRLAVLRASQLIAIEKFGKNPLVIPSRKGLFIYREDILSSNPGSQLKTMSWGWGSLWLEGKISSSWRSFYEGRKPIRLLITQTSQVSYFPERRHGLECSPWPRYIGELVRACCVV